jgi:Na+/H+ antiporter NhaD/arsenite permease-like protein
MDTALNSYTISMIVVFVIGYVLITLEHIIKINKTTIALLMAIICWILQFANHYANVTHAQNLGFLTVHIANISQVVFFLLGALSVVELINVHQGFKIISDVITVQSKRKMLWILGFITFFLSSVLDNLTTTIVMV